MWRHLPTLALVAGLLAGCTSMQPEDFSGTGPELRIEEYFQGQTRAWGIVQNRSGKPLRYFTVDIHGGWEGDDFVLHEDFSFRDGERSQRVWRIRKLDEHSYEGRAEDVVGTAVGRRYGNALNWRYDLLIAVQSRQFKVHFNDWMFLHDDQLLVNRATMTKYGFRVGEIVLFFKRG